MVIFPVKMGGFLPKIGSTDLLGSQGSAAERWPARSEGGDHGNLKIDEDFIWFL